MQGLMICWTAGVCLFFLKKKNVIQHNSFSFHPSFSFSHTAFCSAFFISIFLLEPECPTPTRGTTLTENEYQKGLFRTQRTNLVQSVKYSYSV
jgi:hypothetical protein